MYPWIYMFPSLCVPGSVCPQEVFLCVPGSVRSQSVYFDLFVELDATGVACHQLGLLSADLHAVEALSRGLTNFASSSFSPAKPSMSLAKRRAVIVLPPVLMVPFQKYVEEHG